eukprot:CAMPEP_0167824282 /NCGR_PEP_ID=MMETSP0112_2-20121227/8696_1 /TAXON_ID=91324 /ORGANISM="Lotharella globosa, Strain CCCM811" /LENGTH=96 /DNA_ID=CAMNT_0007726205 /DNA_START=101 /DNA_END=391 /DNA_ORIENTATION=-
MTTVVILLFCLLLRLLFFAFFAGFVAGEVEIRLATLEAVREVDDDGQQATRLGTRTELRVVVRCEATPMFVSGHAHRSVDAVEIPRALGHGEAQGL